MSSKGHQVHATRSKSFNTSALNIFSPPSTPSSQLELGLHPDVTFEHHRKIVEDVINKIFDDQTGYYETSSSGCPTVVNASSEYTFDKRLQYWRSALDERKKIAERIHKKTGKPKGDVLFQRPTTVDERDKRTVQRVLDYADRLHPTYLEKRQRIILKDYIEPETCRYIHEIEETLPRAELDKRKIVNITGLPVVSKVEQLDRCYDWVRSIPRPRWLESKVLHRRVEDKREDLERVIEFYPDIEHLQVIGENAEFTTLKPNAEIEFIGELPIQLISSDTNVDETVCKCDIKLETEQAPPLYGLRINEHIFFPEHRRSAKNVEVEIRFECEPFEKVVKRVMSIKNVGQKVLSFTFVQRDYYFKDNALLKANDTEFVFDRRSFRLLAEESRDIIVQFQPRKVDIVKEKWCVKVEPQFFCRRAEAVIIKLNGRCKPAPEYVNKIQKMKRIVIEKSNLKMMRQLNNNLASITPLLKPNEVICPYYRPLSNLEVFEQLNCGYKCDRYNDLELLKDIYNRIKKPRERAWDLRLETLKGFILRVENPEQRALLFNEMLGILQGMKGKPAELEAKIENDPERDRTRFLYVRGIVSAGIDEWEQLAMNIEAAFVKATLTALDAGDLSTVQEISEEDNADVSPPAKTPILPIWPSKAELFEMEDDLKLYWVTQKVRRDKAFRDSLYVQTYTHLCNFCEDIVSIIESTF